MKRRDFTLVGTSIAGTVLLGCADDLGDGDVDADGTGGMDGSSGGMDGSSGGASSGGASSGGASSGGASAGGASSGGEVGSGGDDASGGEVGSGGDESGSGGDESGSGGDESGSGGDESGSGGDEGGGSCSEADITFVSGHEHTLAMPIPAADITDAVEKTYEIGGSGHTHKITLTPADFAALEADGMVTVPSTEGGHDHQVTLSCA